MKLESENNEYERARRLLAKARSSAPTARVSVLVWFEVQDTPIPLLKKIYYLLKIVFTVQSDRFFYNSGP